jgi:hypothetical protein
MKQGSCDNQKMRTRGTVTANITGSWINVNPPGSEHMAQLPHTHLNKRASVACVYYVNTGDSEHPAGERGDPNRNGVADGAKAGTFFYDESSGAPKSFNPASSGVLVFPGWLSHRQDMHMARGTRMTVAVNFDVQFYPDNETPKTGAAKPAPTQTYPRQESQPRSSPILRFQAATKTPILPAVLADMKGTVGPEKRMGVQKTRPTEKMEEQKEPRKDRSGSIKDLEEEKGTVNTKVASQKRSFTYIYQ